MKHAILSTEQEALDLQSADDDAAGMPWPSVYLDGRPCPTAWTTHRYDVRRHPTEKLFAFPVDASAEVPAEEEPKEPGEATAKPGGGKSTAQQGADVEASAVAYVDELPEDWTPKGPGE